MSKAQSEPAQTLEAARHWERLARDKQRSITEGFACCPIVAQRNANSYLRTALSLRREAKTGIALCTCHLLPYPKPGEPERPISTYQNHWTEEMEAELAALREEQEA